MNNPTSLKLKELAEITAQLTDFERAFVSDNLARVEKYGEENTRFSEKQVALMDNMHRERVTENKPAKSKG